VPPHIFSLYVMETKILIDQMLHPRILRNCMQLHLDGHFKHAAREAMVQVELTLKERGARGNLYGVRLVNALFGKGSGIKLRVPFGPEMQRETHALFQAAFSYYRNYVAHDGSRIDEQGSLRIMVLATELLELIGASAKSFANVGGVEGLVKHGVFSDKRRLLDFLKCFDGYVLPEEAPDGFFEDIAERGFSLEQVDALVETGLVDYESKDIEIPKEMRNVYGDPTERIGIFELTPIGKEVLEDLQREGV